METVLVTDGDQRAALAIVRSLGRAGYRCLVCSGSGRSLAGASRYARRELRVPDPAASPGDYAAAVAAAVQEEGVDLVVPVTEAALLALLPIRDRLEARLPFPELSSVRAICDKARVLDMAARLGIRVPAQTTVMARGEDPGPGTPLPAVLKPTRSVYTASDGQRGKVGVRWVRTRQELEAGLAAYPEAAFPVLIQQPVTGPGIGLFVLLHEGRALARFAHRRLREKPPSGGVSVLRQSEPVGPALLETSLALLDAFDWSGVAMVEYKLDAETGDPVLMEINGRFWGSLQLAIDAGVDFPRLLLDLHTGRALPPPPPYRFARTRWMWGDVDHLLAVWRDSRYGWRSRAAAVGGFLRAFGPGYRDEVFHWRDPRPFFRESAAWLSHALRRP